MAIWAIMDYVDDAGKNRATGWIESLPPGAQAFVENRLLKMRGLQTWPEKWATKLVGWDGLIELRITYKGVQYRPLGTYLPGRKFVLLGGAIEKGDEMPRRHLDAADRRRKQLLKDQKRAKPHEF